MCIVQGDRQLVVRSMIYVLPEGYNLSLCQVMDTVKEEQDKEREANKERRSSVLLSESTVRWSDW